MCWLLNSKPYAFDMVNGGSNPDTVIVVCNITEAASTSPWDASVPLKSGRCAGWNTNENNLLYQFLD